MPATVSDAQVSNGAKWSKNTPFTWHGNASWTVQWSRDDRAYLVMRDGEMVAKSGTAREGKKIAVHRDRGHVMCGACDGTGWARVKAK